MNRSINNQEVVEAIKVAYGSLEQPNYLFQEKRYKALLRHDIIADLMASYFVKNDTDLNDHAALHLCIQDDNSITLELCLSLVSNFAMLFRFQARSMLYEVVVDEFTPDLQAIERDILTLIEKHRFRLLSKSNLAAPICMTLFNTKKSDTRVYHALVDDCGVVPQYLL